MSSLNELPKDLPVPEDDGKCAHLIGASMPAIRLLTTTGEFVDFSSLGGLTVIYLYPMTGRPEVKLPEGWDQIPGARGCTPQSCSFRDHHAELQNLGATVFGLSTQSTSYQQEVIDRLHLPFPLVSDDELKLITQLSLPTIEVDDMILSKRITLIVNAGVIEKVFYPVFPPDQNAEQVVEYLSMRG